MFFQVQLKFGQRAPSGTRVIGSPPLLYTIGIIEAQRYLFIGIITIITNITNITICIV